MENVAVVECGAYLDQGFRYPGEWRCLKPASIGEGKFEIPTHVVAFIKCQCPGRAVVPSIGMAAKLSEIKPDKIYLSACLANAIPGCPYTGAKDLARIVEDKTGIEVIQGTHDYH